MEEHRHKGDRRHDVRRCENRRDHKIEVNSDNRESQDRRSNDERRKLNRRH